MQRGDQGGLSELVGIAGMKRRPVAQKIVQVGLALLPKYHGRRFRQDVVATLGQWALSQPGLDQVLCDIPEDHVAFESRRSALVLYGLRPIRASALLDFS